MNFTQKYVAFCDILGFSAEVLSNFEKTLKVYKDYKQKIGEFPFTENVSISIYSDSILIVGDELYSVLQSAQLLLWVTLSNGWLIRGGVAKGNYWKESDENNLYIVSEALVKAVDIEKKIKYPAIGVSDEIELGLEYWVPYFQYGVFSSAILFHNGITIVNPFTNYWFNSAEGHVLSMLERNPKHKEKYSWFLSLVSTVRNNECLVPESIIKQLMDLGVIEKV